MASRRVVKRAKPWCTSRFVGTTAVINPTVGRRFYCLPSTPPPPRRQRYGPIYCGTLKAPAIDLGIPADPDILLNPYAQDDLVRHVRCDHGDGGAISAAEFALGYLNEELRQGICLTRVVSADVIRRGWSIYSITFEGRDRKGDARLYHPYILHDPPTNGYRLFNCETVSDPRNIRAKSCSRLVSPTFGRRYYYLPPPPPYVEHHDAYGHHFRPDFTVGEKSRGALASAQFAVSMSNLMEGRNVKFARLVRVSQSVPLGGAFGTTYHLTIEGIDENGYRNVYYTRVSTSRPVYAKMLKQWNLVDDMFQYPYSHDVKSTGRVLISPALRTERPDYFRIMSMFEEHVGRSSNELPDAADSVQMCNIIDLEEALHYALYAVEEINKERQQRKEDDIIHLRKLVYASRIDLDGKKIFYHLLVNASSDKSNEVKLYYALVKQYRNEEELIQWREVHNSHKYSAQTGQCA